jgi:putative ABC transport system permease protein
MTVGIASVLTMVALGRGAQQTIEDQVEAAGTNLIIVIAGNRTANGVRFGTGSSSRLTATDAVALSGLRGIAYVTPRLRTRQQVIVAGRNWSTMVEGSGADLPVIRSWPLSAGTFFGRTDVARAAKVCVLGTIVRDMLFGPHVNPVGQLVRVGTHLFRVVGLLASKGQSAGGRDQDDVIFIPYTTAQKKLMGVTYLNAITLSASSSNDIPSLARRVRSLIRARHGILAGAPDDFRVRTLDEIVAVRTRTTRTMTLLLGTVAAVSLVVSGIGVMNIMLVSVAERTREVGLRMAVGARSRDVLLHFLLEALILSILGGVGGVGLGYMCSVGLTQAFDWSTRVSPQAVCAAVAVASGVGIFFGWYPARRAASASPIDALRYE